MKKILPLIIAAFLVTSCTPPNLPDTTPKMSEVHWAYDGENGPEHWGDLNKEFSACKDGKKQSPVNIEPAMAKTENLDDLETDYKEVPLVLINNGHTVQVNYEPGSKIKTGSNEYELLQFHFHTPGEHTIDGKSFPMEVHLVHKNKDGNLAVIGLFFKEGKENLFLKDIWANLPEKEGPEMKLADIKLNAAGLLPAGKEYYNYSGSLTTPGCSEIVNWIVLKETVEASKEQIEKFAKLFHSNNARPVQPLNDRIVSLVQ